MIMACDDHLQFWTQFKPLRTEAWKSQNCNDHGLLDFKSAVQYMKRFIYHFTNIQFLKHFFWFTIKLRTNCPKSLSTSSRTLQMFTKQETVTPCLLSLHMSITSHIYQWLLYLLSNQITHQGFWIFNWLTLPLDSEDGFRTGCRNVSHSQQSFSGLQSPWWSFSIKVCYSWVQTIFLFPFLLLLFFLEKLICSSTC